MENEIKLSIVDTINRYSYDNEEVTSTSRTYVSWGKDNRYPSLIKNLYKNSATLKSIVDGTTNYISGNGVVVNEGAAQFKEEVNRRGDTFNDLITQLGADYMLYKGFAIQVIYTKVGTVAELYALDFSKCRVNESRTKVFYNKKGWGTYSSKYDTYDVFDPSKMSSNHTQIFYFTDGARTIYPQPKYEGAIIDVLSEIECSKYSLNSISNGLASRYVITIPSASNLSKEQKDEIEKGIRERFCGTENTSSFMLYFANGNLETSGLKVDAIATDKQNEEYITIKENARENIFTAFSAIPCLFGLPTKNRGFSKEEFLQAFELYNKTQVLPIQKKIVRCIDKILQKDKCITILPFKLEDSEE